jgi:hypothetical protein
MYITSLPGDGNIWSIPQQCREGNLSSGKCVELLQFAAGCGKIL